MKNIIRLLNGTYDWTRVGQFFVGSFFFSSAVFKFLNYFINADLKLSNEFKTWISNDQPAAFMIPLLEYISNYNHAIAAFVAGTQLIGGLCLAFNFHRRLAAIFLFLLQLGIFMATINNNGILNAFIGLSLILCVYYAALPKIPAKLNRNIWIVLKYSLVLCSLLYVKDILKNGWYSSCCDLQREHLLQDSMSITFWWKQIALLVMANPFGEWIILFSGWMRPILILLMLSRFRLIAGGLLLAHYVIIIGTWHAGAKNALVFLLLATFAWVAQEYAYEADSKKLALSEHD